ncbi:putative bifunctional diguanylate cyclase/phosphodiesterase [Kineococcus glutinatus]|uniref:Diguanylate cyclase/phosphodiesterase n=1 Tax=Kineococcus glutinatus TaxID=1070872 RepID=A0ABP9HCH8_9ACTN
MDRTDDGRLRPATRAERAATVLALLPVVAFVATTVPGVRPQPGYEFLLDGVLNNLAYLAAPVLCWLRLRRTPKPSRAGRLLLAALAAYGLGNPFWTAFVRPLADQPFPSGADAFFLAFYPLLFAALLCELLRAEERLSASLWLDGVVGGLATGALVSTVVADPILSASPSGWAAVATTAAYPLLDLLLLLALAAALAMYGWRPPLGLWLLAAGLVMFVVADVSYLVSTAHGTYESGNPTDGIWVLGVALMAATPGWPARPVGFRLPMWALLAVPLLGTTAALGLLAADHAADLHPVSVALAVATVAAALLRLAATCREVLVLAGTRVLAVTDELTGLGNRRALYQEVPRRLAALPPATEVALLLLDLDRFKEINDSLGHEAGDVVLQEVGTRLGVVLGGRADVAVRLGGDEFAVFLSGERCARAEALARELQQVVGHPLVVSGYTVRPEVSTGVAVLPAGEASLPVLLRRADVAMYRAKAGHLGVLAYDADHDDFASGERLATLELLREAIAARALVLHHQPKVDSGTGEVRSVEALVRWQHPERGLLFPDAFLPLVEDAGLMGDLTAAVLEQALDQVADWRRRGRGLSVAVNLSTSSLADPDLAPRIAAVLAARDLPPETLEIEITEGTLMGDRTRAQHVLADLRRRGIRVAVDDFGTGYSSLAYLKELPIDDLKLDRSFLAGVLHDERAMSLVSSTIQLAHALGLRLVAEGVEDEPTAAALEAAGCDVQQGWFHAKALPAQALEEWLDARSGVCVPA